MAKPNLALIPATIGDKVYSILPSDGVGDFDFTRASTATRINAQGLIEEVASGENRLNYSLLDGEVVGCPHLLLEPQRTNPFPYSENFSHSDWTKTETTITSNVVISPDGTLNASKITENTASGAHRISDTIIVSGAGAVYTQSIFAKSGGNGRFLRMFRGSGTYNFAVFDLDNGVVFSQGGNNIISTKIEKYPNGWFRCISTFTTQFANIATYYGLQNGVLDSYTGDGTSGIYLWGASLEAGSFATSYIKSNSGSATTRAAETATNSGNASTFNDSEGVLMAEISALVDSTSGGIRRLSLSDGTNDNRIQIILSSVVGRISVVVKSGNLFQIDTGFLGYNKTDSNKIAVRYGSGVFKVYINGLSVFNDAGVSFSSISLNNLRFSNPSGSEIMYSKTKQIQYFDTTLIDEQLEELTSWDSFRAMAEGQLYSVE